MSTRAVSIDLERRKFISRASTGLGAIALEYLLGQSAAADTLLAQRPHHPPKAKSIIWCFMEGGPSHLDLFDPKPALEKLAGQPMPESFGKVITAMGTASNTLMPSNRVWKRYGQGGLWISDWYSKLSEHADDMAVLRRRLARRPHHVGPV